MSLKGKVAVITGSATGIGQGAAVALAQAGAKIAVTYHRDPADKTLALIKEAGGEAILVKTDVRSRESIRNLMTETYKAFGRLDILMNNAAIQPNKMLYAYTEDDYDLVMNVNVKGYWRCIQEALPYLKKSEHGRIINVGSIHSKRATGFDAIYSTSKGAVKMLTREAALALGKYGITVNMLSPGVTRVDSGGKMTDEQRKFADRSSINERANRTDIEFKNFAPGGFLSGGPGYPKDMGYVVVFLADEQSQNITGANIRSDSGYMMS